MKAKPTVFVVDNDPLIRETICRSIKSASLTVEAYATTQDFLEAYDPPCPGCLVVDHKMPYLNGIELLEHLRAHDMDIPTIIMSTPTDVSVVIRAMKSGAFDYLEKPFKLEDMLNRVLEALYLDAELERERAACAELQSRVELLTSREREVMDLLTTGMLNKQVAAHLGISMKTVEAHRSSVMRKTRATSFAELVRIGEAACQQEGQR